MRPLFSATMLRVLPLAGCLLLFGASARGVDPKQTARRIDAAINARLETDKATPSPRSDDAEFLRRAYLDLTGRLPPPDAVAAFLDGTDPDKRERLIDELLANAEFGQHLARYWSELFVKRDGEQNKRLRMEGFRGWLADQFNKGQGWDKVVTAMLTVDDDGPAGMFFQANRLSGDRPSPAKVVGTTGNLFLGIQLQCVECHNHPVERWKRTEFWELAAFFGRTRFEKTEVKNVQRVTEEEPPPPDPMAKGRPMFKPPANGVIQIPDALDPNYVADVVVAKFPGEPELELSRHGPYRPMFAEWLTSPKNPWFARAAVNRYWSILFARGFVTPLDDMNPDNQPTHPELFDYLTAEFVNSGFDLKFFFKAVCLSETYQRTSRATPENRDHDGYVRMPVKFLQGEVLLKCLDQVLGVEIVVPTRNRSKEATTAIPNQDLFDTAVYDDDIANYSFGAPQMLRLMNAEVPRRAPGVVAKLGDDGKDPARAINKLFLLTLARRPSLDESKEMIALVEDEGDQAKGLAAVLWVLLNGSEFVSNH